MRDHRDTARDRHEQGRERQSPIGDAIAAKPIVAAPMVRTATERERTRGLVQYGTRWP